MELAAAAGAKEGTVSARVGPPSVHHQPRSQTLMVCSPQYRQRQIWAYQPVPSSSRASCGVSSTQSRQKRRNRSGRSRSKVLLGPARLTTADKSASAATMRYPRLIGNRRVKPLRLCGEARLTRSRTLRRVKGGSERSLCPPGGTDIAASTMPTRYVRCARPEMRSVGPLGARTVGKWNCSHPRQARSSAFRGTPSHRWRARSWWCSARGWSTCGSRS